MCTRRNRMPVRRTMAFGGSVREPRAKQLQAFKSRDVGYRLNHYDFVAGCDFWEKGWAMTHTGTSTSANTTHIHTNNKDMWPSLFKWHAQRDVVSVAILTCAEHGEPTRKTTAKTEASRVIRTNCRDNPKWLNLLSENRPFIDTRLPVKPLSDSC